MCAGNAGASFLSFLDKESAALKDTSRERAAEGSGVPYTIVRYEKADNDLCIFQAGPRAMQMAHAIRLLNCVHMHVHLCRVNGLDDNRRKGVVLNQGAKSSSGDSVSREQLAVVLSKLLDAPESGTRELQVGTARLLHLCAA